MNLKLRYSALGIIVLFGCLGNGLTLGSESELSIFGKVLVPALFVVSAKAVSLPRGPPPFLRRMGGSTEGSVEESEEDENESQARVEPQITPLNRDECLAKLLCGMSVPVTGGGAPKNGYYSEYANIVAKFFEAFPLEEDEKSVESIEAYDDYSVEEDEKKSKPARFNSKLKNVEKEKEKDKPGLQLIDLAVVNKASNATNSSDKTEGSTSRSTPFYSRNIDMRASRARKIVAKLGEKLQTVRQCQQISGCPFTFKQLRSKLKTESSISSNIALDPQTVKEIKYNYNYKPLAKPKPKKPSTEVVLGEPVAPYKDTHKGDDELEEFFGPPPVFGSNKRPLGYAGSKLQQPYGQQQQQQNQQQQQQQNFNEEYIPYEPPVRQRPGSSYQPQQQNQPAFPNKKLGYKIPSYIKRKPGNSGENDEFDDVNQSTGPISLIGNEPQQQSNRNQYGQSQYSQNRPQQQYQFQQGQQNQYNFQQEQQGQYQDQQQQGQYQDNNNQAQNEEQEETNNDDDNEDYNDEGSDEDYGDDDAEEDEEDYSNEEEDEDKKKKRKEEKENDAVKDIGTTTGSGTKSKVKNYKNPNPESLVIIEEEFGPKKPSEDDELEHPDNAWSKLAFAASGSLIKEPKNKNKTELEEKNDQKLGLSKEDSKEDDDSQESNEEEEDDDDSRSRKTVPVTKPKKESDDDEAEEEKSIKKRPSKNKAKISFDDDVEFGKVSESLDKSKPKRKSSSKSRNGSKNKSKSEKKESDRKTKTTKKAPKPEPQSEESEEEQEKKPQRPQLLHIGGRPLVPNPERDTKQSKKTTGLNRFNFNLVRPYGLQTTEEAQLSTYQKSTRTRSTPKLEPSLPTYSQPKPSKSKSKSGLTTNSYKKESIGSDISDSGPKKESYLPQVSFGTSNGGKFGNVEFIPQSTQSQKTPSLITFPFGSPFTSLTRFFKRPSSSGNQDIPGTTGGQAAPIAAFVHRPVGPESSNYRRVGGPGMGGKSRSDRDKGSHKGGKKNKKSTKY